LKGKQISQTILTWILLIVTYALIDSDNCLSLSLGGILVGLTIMTLWMIGIIRGSSIYRKGLAADWMIWFADEPPGSSSSIFQQPKTWKIISAVLIILWLIYPLYNVVIGESYTDICLLSTSAFSWLLGVTTIELYFRKNYNSNGP